MLKSIAKHGARSGLATVLVRLRDAGMFKEEYESSFDNESTVKKDLQHAMEEHSKAQTIYGAVVQSMFLCATIPVWEYCSPVCMLRYLTCISEPFAELMYMLNRADGVVFRILLYIDAFEPGNP